MAHRIRSVRTLLYRLIALYVLQPWLHNRYLMTRAVDCRLTKARNVEQNVNRAGHLRFVVLRCSSKGYFQVNLTKKISYFWIRPIKVSYPQPSSLNRTCKNSIFQLEKCKITTSVHSGDHINASLPESQYLQQLHIRRLC